MAESTAEPTKEADQGSLNLESGKDKSAAAEPAPIPNEPQSEATIPPKATRRSFTESLKATGAEVPAESEKNKPEAQTPAKTSEKAPEATKADDKGQDTPAEEKPRKGRERLDKLVRGEKDKQPDEKSTSEAVESKQEAADEKVLEGLPTDTENMRKRTNYFKTTIEAEKKAKADLETKLVEAEKARQELEAKVSQLPPDFDKTQEENLKLRRRLQLEDDPEIKQKFDDRVQAAETDIQSTLEKHKLGWIAEEAKKLGGFAALAKSSGVYTIKGDDGEDLRLTGKDLYQRVLGAINDADPLDADAIRTSIADQNRLRKDKERHIKEESEKAKEWFETQAKQQNESLEQQQIMQQETRERISRFADELRESDWLADLELPEDATKRTEVEAENAFRADLRALADRTLNFKPTSTDPKERAKETADEFNRVLKDSLMSYRLEQDLETANAKIAKLEAELTKVKKAARTTPSTSSSGGDSAVSTSNGKAPPARHQNETDFAYMRRLREAGFENPAIIAAQNK